MHNDLMEIYLRENGWTIALEETRPPRTPEFEVPNELGLCAAAMKALLPFESGIYRHQKEGIREYLAGNNLAVTTSTASGKTLIFNVCAIEELAAKPTARIAAIYPLKALATEQATRWQKIANDSGLNVAVGRIDGGVPVRERLRVLKESRILVMTPDIIHAWLFSTVAQPAVLDFLRNLSLVILDEAHTYTGVFGSNSAFLFRRLQHAVNKLGGKIRFIASSATMADSATHLEKLTGVSFKNIGPELDTSPRATLKTVLATPPSGQDVLSALSEAAAFAATGTDHQSITFVDSRKQTEYLATIIERRFAEDADSADAIDLPRLRDLQVYPYRSGYEEEDRRQIQKRLASGTLKGVVSTSALEMGLDLPYLTLGILNGIPRSATSYYQRIGRVGRRKDGLILVVNNGSVVSESVFRRPERIKNLPLAQSALYLHNQRIQYIHAMCLARQGGEDEAVCQSERCADGKFQPAANLPEDFAKLCEAERVGEIGSELQAMKAQAGDDPHHTFPLRDLEVQYKVEHRQGPDLHSLGSLSHSQLMREAYPGAVYYYQTRPYRVVRIRKQQRVVEVRQERRYFTSPTMLPTLILPNLTGDNLFQSRRFGDLFVVECAMQIGEAVVGFKERRGNNDFQVTYPLDPVHGLYHDTNRFVRYAFTSGVIFTHPSLSGEHVRSGTIAEIVNEAFLMTLPFERQDISAGTDKHRATRESVKEGQRFLCVYDQTYGSLRLTSHLMNVDVIRDVFTRVSEIARNDANLDLNQETIAAIEALSAAVLLEPAEAFGGAIAGQSSHRVLRVLMRGAIGINVQNDNEEFEVDGVFFSPQFNGLAYRGWHIMNKRRARTESPRHSHATEVVPIDRIVPLEGESKMCFYNMDTGETVDHLPQEGEF